ncbi:unnamed protein product [Alternaria alternata]
MSLRALSRAPRQVCLAARRQYATNYDQRTKETLKIPSQTLIAPQLASQHPLDNPLDNPLDTPSYSTYLQTTHTVLTYPRLTTTAAVGAAALYYTTSSSSSPASSPSPASSTSPSPPDHSKSTRPGHQHESAYASDVPKPVEDRHGDSVNKHSIAAHKNQNKVREGKFSGKEFDNHVQTHSPGKPEGDFEKR